MAGSDQSVCALFTQLNAAVDTLGSGFWVVGGGGSLSFENAASPTSGVTASSVGVYSLVWTQANAHCVDRDTVEVQFNETPVAGPLARICDAANAHYTVSFPVIGGTQPYGINNGAISGSFFISSPIPSQQPYSFQITDVNGCTSPIYTGSYDCNCLSDAGYMSQQVKTACVGQTIKSEPLGGIVTDGNDAVWFYLHDNAGNLLGTIYAINQSGQFSYQPGMVSGATYYISRVVGNGDFMGGINLSDPCLSVSQGQPVIFYAIPVPDAGPDQQICVGPAILNGNGGIGFWGLAGSPAGSNAVVLNPQSSVTGLSVDIPGVYLLSFEVNDNGCIGFDNVQVELLPSPTISGISAICDAASEYYQVGFEVSGGSSPYWVNQVPLSGANFLSDAVVSGDAYVFLVSDDNNCVTTVSGINSCDCASDAGAVSGALVLVCGRDTATVEVLTPAQADANDGLGYVLHTGSGSSLGAVIDQSSTGKFTFQPGMTYGFTYYMSQVVGNTPSGQLDFGDPCLSVSIGQPVVFYPIPIALAGADQRVCGLSTQLSGTGTGSWSSLSGGSVVYPPDDPGGAVTAMDSGAALFEWTVKENGCYGRDTVVVEFLALPVGFNLATECDPTNESFVVSFSIQGGAAPYQVGGDLLTGNYFEGQPLPNGSSYSYQISDANGCNSAPVMGGYSCACGTDAGTMPQQVLTACSGGVVQVVGSSNEILDPNDVAVYVLHDGQGALLGQVFATNTTGLFGFQSGMQYGTTYYVSLVAGNDLGGSPDPADPCFSVSVGQPVRFISTPMPDVGLDTAVCGQTYALTVQSDGLGGNWQWVSGPLGSFFTTPGQASTAVTVQNFGDYAFRWVSDDNGCLGADTLHIRFQPLPQVATLGEVCNDTYTAYALEFTCGSGLPPYSVAGLSGSFNGGVFTSGFLADGSAYSFTVTDANGCASPAVSGTHDCACITFAGTLVTTPALFCAGEAATAVWNNNPTLDGDDGVQFILHSTPGGSLGTVYAVADVPSFALTPPLQPNVTYYIAAVAGSKIAGGIDVSDPCLDISLGTPVRWKPVPEVVFGGDATICAGGSATLSLQATGVFPITVLYAGTGASPFVVSLPNDQPIQLTVSPAVSTTYRLIDATDGVAPLCRVDLADSVVVAVNPPVFAGISGDPAHVCAGITQALDLDSLLVGGMAGGSWSQAGGPPFVPGVLNGQTGILQLGNQEVGSYALQYTLQGLPPCPSSIATVAVEVHPTPTAAAGPDQTLTCLEETLTLGAAVGEPGVTYAWYASGQVQGLAAELSVNTPAVYIQEAISLEGCTDRDTVVVVEDRSYPLASGFSVQDVRCFGDKDGKIVVEGVQSNNPPVLFALSGGSFGESSEFYPLEPGKYTVVLQAANGCEWESDTLIVGQPPQMVAALGSELVVDLGEEAVVQALVNLPGRVDTVLWFPLLDTLHAAELVQVFTPLENQVLAVRILDTNGCATNARVLVVVKNNLDVYVPNIFHPEQGYNNLIGVFGGRQVSLVESFMVYDRWGNLVHEVTDFPADGQSAGWDGRYRGRPLPPGVYVYQAVVRFINGRRRVFSGDITLIR
jgi:gliding motility-associated-like protein